VAVEEPSGPVPAMRASDADRERVVAVLQQALADGRLTVDEFGERSAVAFAARTLDALAGLTRDLVPGSSRSGAAALDASGPAPETAPPVVAVFSGAKRAGRWRPARRETAVAVFGGVEIDLRDAELPVDGIRLSAWAVFGGVDVKAPEGTRVEMSGLALFGGRNVQGDDVLIGPDALVLRVHGVAIFGGVNVTVGGRRRGR
jgi:hypothetical protein